MEVTIIDLDFSGDVVNFAEIVLVRTVEVIGG